MKKYDIFYNYYFFSSVRTFAMQKDKSTSTLANASQENEVQTEEIKEIIKENPEKLKENAENLDKSPKENIIEESNDSLIFSDASLFPKYRVAKVKVWLEADKIYGFKLFYDNIRDPKEPLPGHDHIPSHLLSKPFEEKTIEGRLLKISYRLEGNSMKSLVLIGEKGEVWFGKTEQAVGWKGVEFSEEKGFLSTVFGKIKGKFD